MAKEQNLSILSYLANVLNSPLITIAAPIIAFMAITKSFLGHYIGSYEAMRDMIIKFGKTLGKDIEEKTVKSVILTFVVLTCWYVAYANPSILGLIDALNGIISYTLNIRFIKVWFHTKKQYFEFNFLPSSNTKAILR